MKRRFLNAERPDNFSDLHPIVLGWPNFFLRRTSFGKWKRATYAECSEAYLRAWIFGEKREVWGTSPRKYVQMVCKWCKSRHIRQIWSPFPLFSISISLGHIENKIEWKSSKIDYIKKYLFKYTCMYGNAFNDTHTQKECMKANFEMLLNGANMSITHLPDIF